MSNEKGPRDINKQIEKQLHDDQVKAVKEMMSKSKKGALSLAVAFTISTTITGCNNVNKTEDATYYVGNSRSFSEQDTSETNSSSHPHYYGGGSYYYGRGATYRGGSWGTFYSGYTGSRYSSSKSSGNTITNSKSGLGGSSYRSAGG